MQMRNERDIELMGKTIVIANQKGGVGKTTTAVNLGAALALLGKRTLLIDMDPQGNTTSGLGIDKDTVDNSVYELLLGEADLGDCIIHKVYKELSLIPSNINLAAAEIELIDIEKKEFLLRDKLEEYKKNYDFILIDCPPSLNILTINSMCAADSVLIPIQCEYYALEGLSQLLHTIELVTDRLNTSLQIEGVLFTMYDGRTNLSQQVVENVRDNLHLNIYESKIPRNVRLAEAPSYGLPITDYDPRSTGADSYMKLARELIKSNNVKKKGSRSK